MSDDAYENSQENKNYMALGQAMYEVLEEKDPSPEQISWSDLPPMEQELYSYAANWVIIQAIKRKMVAKLPTPTMVMTIPTDVGTITTNEDKPTP